LPLLGLCYLDFYDHDELFNVFSNTTKSIEEDEEYIHHHEALLSALSIRADPFLSKPCHIFVTPWGVVKLFKCVYCLVYIFIHFCIYNYLLKLHLMQGIILV
jgi:hypothetical protein